MNSLNSFIRTLLLASLAGSATPTLWGSSADVWSGGGGTNLNWSNPNNFSSSAPGVAADVIFGNTGVESSYGAPNNLVDANFTVSALSYSALANYGYHITRINPNCTLTIAPQSDVLQALGVGTWATGQAVPSGGGGNDIVYATILGTNAALVLTAPNTSIRVSEGSSSSSGTHYSVLDLAGLDSFSATVSNVLIGSDVSLDKNVGYLYLARTNVVRTAAMGSQTPGVLLGQCSTSAGFGYLQLGQANTFYCDWMAIGGFRANGNNSYLYFGSGITNGSFLLRGSAGGRAPFLSAGDNQANEQGAILAGNSRNPTGIIDLRGGAADVLVDTLALGRNFLVLDTTGSGNTGIGTGTLIYDTGTVDANTVYLGWKAGTNYGGATGTLNLTGSGLLTVHSNVVMGARAYASGKSATGTLTVASNAVARISGDILKGAGSATLTLSDNAVVDLQPAGDPQAGNVTLDALSFNGGQLQNFNTLLVTAGSFNGGVISNGLYACVDQLSGSGVFTNVGWVTNTTSLVPGSATVAGNLGIHASLVFQTNAALTFALSSTTELATNNAYLRVGGNLVFNGNNSLTVQPLGAFSSGTNRLIDYGGSLSGAPSLVNLTRYNLALDYSVPGRINLVNNGGASKSLTWKGAVGGSGSLWDVQTTANWNNNIDEFYQADAVTFDDTAATNFVTVSGTIYPVSLTVNSSTSVTLGGAGKLSGSSALTKNGTGVLVISNSGGNDFSGPIQINAGTFKVGRADCFGSATAGTTIAPGATLDLAGVACNSSSEWITVAGSGSNGAGVVVNNGADQQNALRYLALSADAVINSGSGRWDIRGPNGSYSGGLSLNGYNLIKAGLGTNALVDLVATNSGSIIVSNGALFLTRCWLDGAGSVSVLGNDLVKLENCSAGVFAKPFVFNAGGTLQVSNSYGNATVLSGPLQDQAGLVVDTTTDLIISNTVSGAGALTKTSPGTLVIQGSDLRSGPTYLNAGALVLGSGASLANTPFIQLASGTVLDASAASALTLGGGQTLSGVGLVAGNLNAVGGCVLAPGLTGPGTLSISGNVGLTNAQVVVGLSSDPSQIGGANDLLSAGRSLSVGGTITLNIQVLGPLSTSSPYTVMVYSNGFQGSAASLQVTCSNPRYSFRVVDPATTPGRVEVQATGQTVSVAWQGGQTNNPTVWDSVTSNWLVNGSSGFFYSGDSVSFSDSSRTNLVTLLSNQSPSAVTVNNSSVNYTFAGAGGIVAGSLTKNGTASMTLSNAATNIFSLGIALNAGTLVASPTTNAALVGSLSDDGGGAATLLKLGPNTLYLCGSNSGYNGQIQVNGGTLAAGSSNALGSSAVAAAVATGATLDVAGQPLGDKPIQVTGAGVNGSGALVNNGSSEVTNALQNLTLTGDTTFGGAQRWGICDPITYQAFLSTSGKPYNLTKTGSNVVDILDTTLDDALANITVAQGTLSLEGYTLSPGGGIGNPTCPLTVQSNAVLQLVSLSDPMNKPLVLQPGATLAVAAGANSIQSPVGFNGSNTFNIGANSSLTLMNTLSGTGLLYKAGTGTLELMANNAFTGSVFVAAGNLQLSGSQTLGTNRAVALGLSTSGGGQTGTRLTLNGGVSIPAGVSLTMSSLGSTDQRSILYVNNGNNQWQGPILFSGDGTVNICADSASALLTINGPLSGTLTNLALRGNNAGVGIINNAIQIGSARLQKTENSTWVIATNHNTWGATLLSNGYLQLGTNDACPSNTFMSFGEPKLVPILDLHGFNQQLGGIVSAADPTNNFIWNGSSSADSVLTIAGTNVTDFGGWILDYDIDLTPSTVGGHLSLTLATNHTGTLTLSGTNGYTGPTRIEGGTLVVNGCIDRTPVQVYANATLAGNGTLLGTVTVLGGGTLQGGPAVGALAIKNNLTFNAGATNRVRIDLGQRTNDCVVGLTNVVYGGTLNLNITGALASGQSFKLFSATNYSGSFSALLPAQPAAGLEWDTSTLAVDGTLRVASAPQLQTIARLSGTSLRLTATGKVGDGYRLLMSTNLATPLTNWTLLSQGTISASPFTLDDTTATNASRFYLLTTP